jgi:hypothetical protein
MSKKIYKVTIIYTREKKKGGLYQSMQVKVNGKKGKAPRDLERWIARDFIRGLFDKDEHGR